MPNSWFRFKQFHVGQERCAMKVSTDACIQGAWTAQQLQHMSCGKPLRLLDIGTGTGLLSLMLAQEYDTVLIDAIELNEDAAQQAAGNFAQSPWHDRLRAMHTSLAEFKGGEHTYDIIICNPPFFHNQLQAVQQARNDARHSTALDKPTLAQALAHLLKEQGYCSIMYPASEWKDWLETAAGQGLQARVTLAIHPRGQQPANRFVGIFGKDQTEAICNETLVIYEEDQSYTPAFSTLLQPYYLAL